MIRFSGSLPPLKITFEEPEPEELIPFREFMQQFNRNSAWLNLHWKDILPKAAGKFIAIAGEEAFVSETHQEAWSRAKAAHPEDLGTFSQFVPSGKGPRIFYPSAETMNSN
jgi:hypothetical protein